VTKVLKIELLVVDHDGVGAEEITEIIENARYPNRCIAPSVMKIETREVEWHDDHALNLHPARQSAYEELFASKEPA